MNDRVTAKAAVQQALGYVFSDPAKLEQALTHPSVRGTTRRMPDNYERLEFLGDRVLGLVIATALVQGDSNADEGDLSKRLHNLVSRDACVIVARSIGIGAALRLPPGETRRGARDQDKPLADAMEAVLAAVFLDGGYDAAHRVVLHLWANQLAAPSDEAEVNPKSRLQELAAARQWPAPAYRIVERAGPDHAPIFTIEVSLGSDRIEQASGPGRQAAEKTAARQLLKRLSLT